MASITRVQDGGQEVAAETETQMVIPCVVYAAKSTADEHGSIQTQIEDCLAAIEREGGGRFLYAEPLADEGFTAFTGNRGPNLVETKRLAAEASAIYGQAEFWMQHSDRLARGDGLSADHLAEAFFQMRRQGVRLRSFQDDSNFEDVIRVTLVGERNHEDSRRKSEAVKSGMRRRVERGKPVGGAASYGYQWVPDHDAPRDPRRAIPSKLVPRPDEAPVVERIFRAYDGGVFQKQIVRDLIADGIPARRGSWIQGTISTLLRNPVYVGRNRLGDDAVPGEHEPIIDPALWERVQRLLEAQTRTKGKGRGRPSAGTHLFMHGLLKCGSCGSSMLPRTIKARSKTGEPYEVYLCSGRVRDVDSCSQTPIKRALVDRGVEQHLLNVGVDVEATAAELAASMNLELAQIDGQLAQAQRDEAKAQERFSRVRRAFQDGEIDPQDWAEQRAELLDERKASAAKLERLTAQRDEVAAQNVRRDAEEETLRWLAAIRDSIVGELRDAASVEALRASSSS